MSCAGCAANIERTLETNKFFRHP
ncbi:MAG: heavy metal-associated domain-containing protein [Saprospiraceae bacterium]